ncbi:transposable element Tcb1 transposase [Trichonephila clavipes]|nr:transposable element Tcb1 transposase [Trichonephila clavipes]
MQNSCVMHSHTGPASGIMVWGGIGYHSRTPLVRIAGTLNSQCNFSKVLEPVVLPYLQGLATAIFQQDNAFPHVARIVQRFLVNHQIELLPWPARSPDLSPIENMWSMVAQRLTQITPPAATPDQLWQRVEAAWSDVPQEHIQSLFESMPRRVAAVISNNGGCSGYWFSQEPNFTEVYKFNHLIIGQHIIYKINFVVLHLVFLGVAFTVASSVFFMKNMSREYEIRSNSWDAQLAVLNDPRYSRWRQIWESDRPRKGSNIAETALCPPCHERLSIFLLKNGSREPLHQ